MLNIKENIPLAEYTTLKVGGSAKFFIEAQNEEEVLEAVKFAREKKLPIFVLGGGSNILVSDKGFDGVVIKLLTTSYKLLTDRIECGAGCNLGLIVNESVKAGLAGLEWAAGIPGTVGGAIRGNAGAFGGEMAGLVESVKALDLNDSSFKTYDRDLCKFEYRSSVFKENPNLIVFSATLKFQKGSQEESDKKVKEIISQRNALQPKDFPSSGSYFKNPTVEDKKLLENFEKDTGKKAENGVVPAGYVIEALGLRGEKIGGAMVSQKHGNFLVNTGKATAEEFIILAALIKTRARNTYGVQLQEEVQMVGF